MKRIVLAAVAGLIFSTPLAAQYFNFPPGTFGSRQDPAPAPSYTGPGDITTFLIWGSVARVYNAALANTSTNLADLVASTGGAAVCTLRGSTAGTVDLAASYCAGTTPSAACAAASGGSCKVSKLYDQVGTNHWTQGTLSAMPTLTFSAVNGLPSMSFVRANSQTMSSGSGISQTAPYVFETVTKRDANNGDNTLVGTVGNNSVMYFEFNGGAGNKLSLYGGNALVLSTTTITEGNWNVIQGGFVNGTGTINITSASQVTGSLDATTTSGAASIGGVSPHFSDAQITEAGIYAGAYNSTVQSNARTAYGL